MKKIELENFSNEDLLEETEITITDWFRVKIEEKGQIYIRVKDVNGYTSEIEFNDEGEFVSLVRDLTE